MNIPTYMYELAISQAFFEPSAERFIIWNHDLILK